MDTELFDTIVIGAGPVGSYAAYLLANNGLKVAVLEEHNTIGIPMQCSGIISVECFDHFQLSRDSVIRKANSARFFSPSGKVIQFQSKKPQAYIVDRTAFDRQIANMANMKGAKYFTKCHASNVTITSDRITVYIDTGLKFEGQTAIIASGFYSKLAQQLGLEKFRDFMTGAQAEVTMKETSVLEEIEVYLNQSLAPGFFAWLVPTTSQKALAGLFSRSAPRKHLRVFLKQLYDQGRIASEEVPIVHGGIPLISLGRTYYKRILIAGDAAGQVKPTTGGGVYYGMICAQLAANTIKDAIANNDFSEHLMSSYHKAWQKNIGHELRNGYYARRIYEKCSNRLIDQLFDIILKRKLHEIINESEQISFDWHSQAFSTIIKETIPRLLKP